MNERIRELAEQASMTDDKFGMYFAKNNHNEDGVDLEKFAQLIVKECCQVLSKETIRHDGYGYNQHALYQTIREHFGVAE